MTYYTVYCGIISHAIIKKWRKLHYHSATEATKAKYTVFVWTHTRLPDSDKNSMLHKLTRFRSSLKFIWCNKWYSVKLCLYDEIISHPKNFSFITYSRIAFINMYICSESMGYFYYIPTRAYLFNITRFYYWAVRRSEWNKKKDYMHYPQRLSKCLDLQCTFTNEHKSLA
jgi:hypothetical protein